MGKAAEETFYCVELTAFFCVGSEIIRNCLHWFPTKQNCPRRRTESLRRRSQNVCDEQPFRNQRKSLVHQPISVHSLFRIMHIM